ncbi:hypothetical protein IAR55_004167 [Kwoniella newhampshirensis]|uniref:Glycosyltransferase family 28 N-terminal domain-containing protein n=1 Tax=Kwoniella newhampshirensis TaxID=1651941 RepID=A0AAW0YYB7_9TREE
MSEAPPPPYEAGPNPPIIYSPSSSAVPPPSQLSVERRPTPFSSTLSSTTTPRYTASSSASSDLGPSVFSSPGDGLDASASWSKTGDVDVWIDLKAKLPDLEEDLAPSVKEYAVDPSGDVPILNIVMFVVGNSEEIQIYIALALELIIRHSHRVRIATQEAHKGAIERAKQSLGGKVGKDGRALEYKLDIFDIYDSPTSSLAEWCRRPDTLEATFRSFYKSTYWPEPISGSSFAADLIVACPSAVAHIHVAELLGLPLHIVSATPWSPTTAFSQPYTTIRRSNAEARLSAYLSYALIENLMWKSLGKTISDFRQLTLGLPPSDKVIGPGLLDRLKIPFTYCWSSLVASRPADWKEHIDVTGFIYPNPEPYRPDDQLLLFLKEGPPPIYVKLEFDHRLEEGEVPLSIIIGGLKKLGSRVIVAGKGATDFKAPDVFVIPDGEGLPLNYLLANARVAAICHDGGTYVTSMALKNAVPSIIIRTNASSRFWGDRVYEVAAGSRPIPIDELSVEHIASALDDIYSPKVREAVRSLSNHLRSENGTDEVARSIHRHLPLLNMRCDVIPSRAALWYDAERSLRLSGVAAAVLAREGKLSFQQLELNRPREYPVSLADSDPIIGGVQAFFLAITKSIVKVTHMFSNPAPQRVVDIASQQPILVRQIQNPKGGWTWQYERDTRPRMPITDMKSGMREAGQEAWTGMKDGMKGVVMEPLRGLQRAGPIGGILGLVQGSVGLATHSLAGAIRAVELGVEGGLSEARNRSGSGTTTQIYPSSPADVLRSSRAKTSMEEAKSLTEEEKRQILEEYKRAAKIPERVEARKRRQERISQGLDVAAVGHVQGGIALGVTERPDLVSAKSGSNSGVGKWWKGKGKGKGKEKVEATLSPSISISGSSHQHQKEIEQNEKEQEAQAEVERSQRGGFSGGQ